MDYFKSKATATDVKEVAASSPTHEDFGTGSVADNADHLKRRLNNRQVQLLALGGSIGTALFVSIGGQP